MAVFRVRFAAEGQLRGVMRLLGPVAARMMARQFAGYHRNLRHNVEALYVTRIAGSRFDRRVRAPRSGFKAFGFGFVQSYGGAHKSLECFLVNRLALVEVDGAPRVPVKTPS